jgi:hypothetical protein
MSALQFPTYNAVIVSGTKWSEAIPWFKKHVTPTDYVAGSLVRDCFVGRPDCRRYVRLATICVEYLRTDYTDCADFNIKINNDLCKSVRSVRGICARITQILKNQKSWCTLWLKKNQELMSLQQ